MADRRDIDALLQRAPLDAVGADYAESPEGQPLAPPPIAPYRTAAPFVCRVAQDGGAAGGEAAECTWTYTVTDLADNTLKKNAAADDATAMTPRRPRYHFCEYWYAGEDRGGAPGATTTYAYAAYDGAALVLLECLGEIDKDTPCDE